MSDEGYRTLRVDGAGAAAVTDHALEVLRERDELDVRHLAQTRIGVSRTYRPTWALVLAILLFPLGGVGLLFLLVKTTEGGEVVSVDGPTGTVVSVPPVVSEPAFDQLGQALREGRPRPREPQAPPGPVVAPGAPSPPTAPPPAPQAASAPPPPAAPPAAAPPPAAPPASSPPPPPPLTAGPDAGAGGLEDQTVRVGGTSTGRALLVFEAGTLQLAAGDRVVLGRDPVALADGRPERVPGDSGTVSKSHALVTFDGSRATVCDLHSTNGTRLHDEGKIRVVSSDDEVIVPAGARVELGRVSFAITLERGR